MSLKTSPLAASLIHPPVGTIIDGGSLELVEVLGVGGYGVVYRAVDPCAPSKSYAVKCLVPSGQHAVRQRQAHIREIALHQLASSHPGVVTLHRVVGQGNHIYLVMDYSHDHDLTTQILNNRRYLGDDVLIKDVFLQLLDAVEYCHSLGIYHRDLKPENILSFDDGLRVAITDFGLATIDKVSDEFRTGSVYYMSPECQGGEFAPTGNYSPMSNDIWSLGIILLNLATGRNPWKSATPGDPTFQAYLRDPMGFLPTVLPISPEINDILVRMLEVDWRERASLHEVRYAIKKINSFYSDSVVFEGTMAGCPWESSMDIDSASSSNGDDVGPHSPPAQSPVPEEVATPLKSRWSKDSNSDIIFAAPSYAGQSSYGARWTTYSSCGATWDFESPVSSESDYDYDDHYGMDLFDRSATPSFVHTAQTSVPTTPESFDQTFGARLNKPDLRSGLMINTNIPRPHIYDANLSMSSSPGTSIMHTAIEYDPYSSMFFVNSPALPKAVVVVPDSAIIAVGEDKEMISPSTWPLSSATQKSSLSTCSDFSSSSNSFAGEDHFTHSRTPSPEPNSGAFQRSSYPVQVESLPPQQCQLSSSVSSSVTDITPNARLTSTVAVQRRRGNAPTTPTFVPVNHASGKSSPLSRFAIKFFPRPLSLAAASPALTVAPLAGRAPTIIQETLFRISPQLPSQAKDNPFANAQLNDLSGKIRKEGFLGGGSHADVYVGYVDTGTTSTKVAIKQLRSVHSVHGDIEKLKRRLKREMRIWGNLDHPNIVSFLGITSDFGEFPAMICQWMDGGTLREYLAPEKGSLDFRGRLDICIAIANGLSYLHSQKVVHGDLKPDNILMDGDIAHISDFGLSNVITEIQGPSFMTCRVGATRWNAPELVLVLDDTTPELTMSSDVYSFATVACYVITNVLPYADLNKETTVIAKMLKNPGIFPSMPAQLLLTAECWEAFTICWALDPSKRPDIDTVIQRLQMLEFS